MHDDSVRKFFFFFVDWGWLVYLIIAFNEAFVMPIFTPLLFSDYGILNFIGGVLVLVLGLGMAATGIGLVGRVGILGTILYLMVIFSLTPGLT